MIEIDHLTKKFGPITAVDDVSFNVERGEVVGFLGPNGAGKTTTLKMVTGFLRPSSGTSRVCGYDVLEDPIDVKKRIGYLPEAAPIWPDMTTLAFLKFISSVRGYNRIESEKRIETAVSTTELFAVLEQPIDTLSKGYKHRVGLAQALLHDPEVLILDEPTDGLDPNQKYQVRELIRDIADEKVIVVSTHILEEVEAVCSRAVIIAKGHIVADSSPESLLTKSSGHNVVTVRSGNPATLKTELGKIESIREVEIVDESRLRIFPVGGISIIDEVGALLRETGVRIDELHVERGRLDDVFRQITMES